MFGEHYLLINFHVINFEDLYSPTSVIKYIYISPQSDSCQLNYGDMRVKKSALKFQRLQWTYFSPTHLDFLETNSATESEI